MFSFDVKIPVDRGLSGTHQENRNASDFYDSYGTELGSSGTDWDAYFCTFSYIVRIADRKNPQYLRSLRHMRTRLKHNSWLNGHLRIILDSSLMFITILNTYANNNENFIIFKQYYIYNYTSLYLKAVHNWLVCYQNLKSTTKYNKRKRI